MRREKPTAAELVELAAKVKLMVLDVDGVLTEGGLFYGPQGELQKRFDVKDGFGLVLARLTGLPAAIITGRSSSIVEVRAKEIGFAVVHQGQRDKATSLRKICAELSIEPSQCAYMGDDLNDLPAMALCGLPSCPSDAVPEVRSRASFVAQNAGGRGAVRELVELCLKASGRWEQALALIGTDA